MDGKSLSLVTADMLEKRGMGFGTALGVVSEIQKLLDEVQTGTQPAPSMFLYISLKHL
jgi:hypothetical protein